MFRLNVKMAVDLEHEMTAEDGDERETVDPSSAAGLCSFSPKYPDLSGTSDKNAYTFSL